MTAWKLAYENRFPRHATSRGTIVSAFRAAEGRQDVASGPVFTSSSGFGGFGIGTGRNLFYRPADQLQGVIGLDVTIGFGVIALFNFGPIPLFTAGAGGLHARLQATGAPTASGFIRCRLTVRFGGESADVEHLVFHQARAPSQLEHRRLRVRWESKGQLQVWLDDDLVAFENALAAGGRTTLDRIVVGDADLPMSSVLNATVSFMRVVELREDAAAGEFGTMLDPLVLPPINERCEKSSGALLERLMRDMRALMAGFNASQTTPWRSDTGGSPFSDAALAVHKDATEAGRAFSVYIRSGSDGDRQALMDHIEAMLAQLAADQPDRFKALAQDAHDSRERLDEHCKKALDTMRLLNPGLFKRLDPLSADLGRIVADLGGTA